ncbi:MAG: type II toxin-antitoxin system VapC family toxin [Zetaproteobacteria bacterium]|nr:MAG: type II toxin-antitoxin system VapC family toxin [Zetaproteobacteria bacterium]
MILYLDTSALVKAYVEEEHSRKVLQGMNAATASASHKVAYVEARAAFARLQREHVLDDSAWESLKCEFITDWENYVQIGTTKPLLVHAAELAEAFALRAYDSMHLAAAHMLHEQSKEPVIFACYDRRLNQAAEVLGMRLLEG